MELFESNFDKFWAAWPKSIRKGSKSDCLKRWKKGMYDGCTDQIIKHVVWMTTTDAWRKSEGAFIPAPLVYLNQQRWDGAEIPENFTPPNLSVERIDPALQKITIDSKKAAPMPEHIRMRFSQIKK